jgi:ParB/RepB/Spo0J family partition protein
MSDDLGIDEALADLKVGDDTSTKVMDIPLKSLQLENLDRNKTEFSGEKQQELIDSIQAQGLISPIVVHELEEKPGTYRVIAGKRRVMAYKKLKREAIPAIIRNVSGEFDFQSQVILDNVVRTQPDVGKYVPIIKEWLETGVCKSQEEAAKKLGLSQSWVSKMLRYEELPDEVKAGIKPANLPSSDEIEGASPEEIVKKVSDKIYTKLPSEYLKPSEGDAVPLKVHVSKKAIRLQVEIAFSELKDKSISQQIAAHLERIGEKELFSNIKKFKNMEFSNKVNGKDTESTDKANGD